LGHGHGVVHHFFDSLFVLKDLDVILLLLENGLGVHWHVG